MRRAQAVWAEFMPYRWLLGDLPRLAQQGYQLNLAIPISRWPDPELVRLLQAASTQNVPIGAWLLLDDQSGYWPNAENAEAFRAYVQRFLDWLEHTQLRVAEILVDMETPLALSRLLKGQLLSGLQLEWQRWRSPRNRERFALATQQFTDMVSEIHQAGLQVEAVSYPFLVHDAVSGNRVFQEFLQVPVLDVPWDGLALMVYRSSFQDLAPVRLGPWLVYRYLELAKAHIDLPLTAALGVVGSIGKISEGGFRDPSAIRADIAAARAAGIERLQLFSLDGMHELGAPDTWLRLTQASTSSPTPPQALPGDRLIVQTLLRSHALLSATATVERELESTPAARKWPWQRGQLAP